MAKSKARSLNESSEPLFVQRALQGAVIAAAFLLIVFFAFEDPNPGSLKWMILPLISVPTGGALGGILHHYLEGLREEEGWKRVLAYILSVVGYLIIVGFAFFLGLHGPW